MRLFFRYCAVLAGAASLFAADPFYLKNGDTVVFYGDSITDQRLYTTYTEAYAVTRFPKLKLRFVHSGWGGDRVEGGGGGPIDLRLNRDVITYHPTVVTVMLGMNDGRYRPYDEPVFNQFASGYKHLIDAVKAALPGVRMTVIDPSPYDDVTRAPLFAGGYNAVLIRYGDYLKQLATQEHADFADLNTSVVDALKKAYATDPELAARLIPDRVHPGPAGHLLMAEALLKSWNAPSVVSEVDLDADSGTVKHAEQTDITGVSKTGGLTWTQQDAALPMPLEKYPGDALMTLALHSSDFMDALDREMLRVTGLHDGSYTLRIDDTPVATFTNAQLENGVNLAGYKTPMSAQAADVLALTYKHNNMHFARWRMVQVPLAKNDYRSTEQALHAMDALEDEIVDAQRQAAQPKPHQYSLSLQ